MPPLLIPKGQWATLGHFSLNEADDGTPAHQRKNGKEADTRQSTVCVRGVARLDHSIADCGHQ
jgi:hypothetical protein